MVENQSNGGVPCLILSDRDLTPRANLMPLAKIGLADLHEAVWARVEQHGAVMIQRGAVCKVLKSPDHGEDVVGDAGHVFLCETGEAVSEGLLK